MTTAISGLFSFGVTGLSDLSAQAYTDSALGTPVGSPFNASHFTDLGNGDYDFAGDVDNSATWLQATSVIGSLTRGGLVGNLAEGIESKVLPGVYTDGTVLG